MMIVGAVLALLIGAVLGMLGGGGGLLTLPMLVYVLDVPPAKAVSLSLAVVAGTSVVALIPHARAGHVRWATGAVVGLTGMLGAAVGSRGTALIPPGVLMGTFGGIMVLAAVAMLRPSSKPLDPAPTTLSWPRAALAGLSIGALSGLVGAGGGFLIVPVLFSWGGVPLRSAVGTSLLVIALQSMAGLASHAADARQEASLLLTVVPLAVVGSLGGAVLGRRLPVAALKSGFGWLVLATGTFVLVAQQPPHLRPWLIAGAAVLGLGMIVWLRAGRQPMKGGNG